MELLKILFDECFFATSNMVTVDQSALLDVSFQSKNHSCYGTRSGALNKDSLKQSYLGEKDEKF